MGHSLDLQGVEFLTFDCYGTLIDWETGIFEALHPILVAHGHKLERVALLERYGAFEAEVESGSYLIYRDVLRKVVDRFGDSFGFEPTKEECDRFAASVADWPAFPDSRDALERLAAKFKLVVLSNVDDDLFEGSNRKLGSPFYAVFTAKQIGSYKPNSRNFRFAIERLGGDVHRILHVAQSLYHDIKPAREIGLRTVWINRRAGQEGGGATPAVEARPDAVFATLAEFSDAVG